MLAEFSSLSCRTEVPVFLQVLARVILSPKSPTFLARLPPDIFMAGSKASLSLVLGIPLRAQLIKSGPPSMTLKPVDLGP